MQQEIILWAIIIAILGSAISYIIVQKRKGVKCIGCPSEANCCSNTSNSPTSSCSCADNTLHTFSCACNSKHDNTACACTTKNPL